MKNQLLYANTSEALFISLIVIVICVLLFLALRAIVLWYWKIDTIVSNQQKQIELLTKILLAVPKNLPVKD